MTARNVMSNQAKASATIGEWVRDDPPDLRTDDAFGSVHANLATNTRSFGQRTGSSLAIQPRTGTSVTRCQSFGANQTLRLLSGDGVSPTPLSRDTAPNTTIPFGPAAAAWMNPKSSRSSGN